LADRTGADVVIFHLRGIALQASEDSFSTTAQTDREPIVPTGVEANW
jgi:hypothetical protein